MENKVETLKEISLKLMELMGVNAQVEVSFEEDNNIFNVSFKSDEATGLLIGKKGETLSSIENLLSVILKNQLGQWYRVSVNIGDYKEKEEDYLKSLADSVAQRVSSTGNSENIYNLKGWQRRIIHLFLAENYKDLSSESTGEGEERSLVVSIKK